MKFSFAAIVVALFSVAPAAAQVADGDKGDIRVNPDPHYRTFDGTPYDYHGGCDTVLVHNSILDFHIRTVATTGFSYISHAAVRIGGDTLEVNGDNSKYYVDGDEQISAPLRIGGKSFTLTTTASSTTWELTLDNGQYIRIERWGPTASSGSLSVSIHADEDDFGDSMGMGGMWNMPGLVGRDYQTYTNTTEFALTWQVDSAVDPVLFKDAGLDTCDPPGTPNGCVGRRGDQEGGCDEHCKDGCVTEDEAKEACKNIDDPDLMADCEFDVKTTGIKKWAKAPFYKPPLPPQPDARCSANKGNLCRRRYGGKCVWKCVKGKYEDCLKDLCTDASKPIMPWDSSLRSQVAVNGWPIKEEHTDCPDCACQVKKPGYYHNKLLHHLEFDTFDPSWPCARLMTAEEHGFMIDAATKFMINKLHTEEDLTLEIGEDIKALVDKHLRHTDANGEEYIYYDDISKLLHMLRGLSPTSKVSPELERALDHVYYEAKFQQDVEKDMSNPDDAGGEPRLDEIVSTLLFDVEWASEQDQEFVETFKSVYEASVDYWSVPENNSKRSGRIAGWITKLADALGGALGGAAGAAAGGPIGAAIGGGLMAAAASHVFS